MADMQDLAREHGGECLSAEYTNARSLLRWRCAAGHEWSAMPCNVRNKGSWCPSCAGVVPHSIEEMYALARQRGGACLSRDYGGVNHKLRWQCGQGHEWDAIPKTVMDGTWCPVCAGNLKSTLEDMHAVASLRGGWCDSEQYLGDAEKLLWRCASGHSFTASPSNVKRGRWCPTCSTALGERLVRAVFEQLFGASFPRVRPSWLRGEHGSLLELDGYSEALGLAFEHQGEQHYAFLHHFHASRDDFDAQRRRDEEKQRLCLLHGVVLIEVPEIPSRMALPALATYVLEQVKAQRPSLEVRMPPEAVDFRKVYQTDTSKEWRETLAQLAVERGGRLLSADYKGQVEPLEWTCAQGHRWNARPANILQGQWCRRCSGYAKLTLNDLHEAARQHGGVCLATDYQSSAVKVRWRCMAGHEFEAAFATVRAGHWCGRCKRVARLDLATMHALAQAQEGAYLSPTYEGINVLARWRCAHGHEFDLSANAVKNRKRWCLQCKTRRPTTAS